MKVENIMSTDLVVGNIKDTIYDITNLMKKNDIGFIPICNNKKIVGVITDRDIVARSICNNCSPDELIEDYITNNIISIDKSSNIEDAIKLMGEKKVKRLLITNDKKVVGIVSLSDIINANIDSNIIIESLKSMLSIFRNVNSFDTEIDEYYL